MKNTNHSYIVYIHINKFNDKKYVGITWHKNPNRRWQNGEGYKKQKYFYTAIREDGWENFVHEILFEGLSEAEAKQKESELITKYRTYIGFKDCCGYNMTLGGDGCHKYKTAKEAHAVYLARQKRIHTNRKLDPEKSLKDKLSNEQSRTRLYADPDRKQRYLETCSKNQKTRYNTELGKAKILKSAAKSKQKLKSIRVALIELYKQYPKVFTEEQLTLIFSKDSKGHYECNSIKKLTKVLDAIESNSFITGGSDVKS